VTVEQGELSLLARQILIIAGRTMSGTAYLERMEEMDKESTKVIADSNRAVNVEVVSTYCLKISFSLVSYRTSG